MITIAIGIDAVWGKSSGYISMLNFMPFLPNDLSANAKKPENVVNKRMDGWTIIPININKLRASRLDTSACQNVEFFPRDLSLIPKSKLTDCWTDGRTHKMKTIPIQHAKFYAISSKWFVNKRAETWTRHSEKDSTPQPLDQWMDSPFMGQQVGN